MCASPQVAMCTGAQVLSGTRGLRSPEARVINHWEPPDMVLAWVL